MPGGSRNHTDLVNEALAKLGVLAAGQPTDPEDFLYVNEMMDACFRMLNDLNICAIPDPDNIPGQWFLPLADVLAGECATKFGSQADMIMTLKDAGLGGSPGRTELGAGSAAKALKEMRRGRPTYERLKNEYF
jgi:hypothetical protein